MPLRHPTLAAALQILMLGQPGPPPCRRCVAQALWNICTPSTLEALIASSLHLQEGKIRRSPGSKMPWPSPMPSGCWRRRTTSRLRTRGSFICRDVHDCRRKSWSAKNKVLGAYTLLCRTRSTRLTAGLAACNLLRDSPSKDAARTGALHVVRVLSVRATTRHPGFVAH